MKLKSFLLIFVIALPSSAFAQEIDTTSGLIKNTGWELVRGNCGACHSLRLVTSNSGSKDEWLATIRWMQATQKLWQFDQKTEDTILSYLAENYPPLKASRRAAIPDHLLPE